MKRLFFVALVITAFISCSRKEESERKADINTGERVEITPLIINSVILRDTTPIKTVYAATDSGRAPMLAYENYFDVAGKFLSSQQFNQLKQGIQAVVASPGSQVYLDWNKEPLTKQEIRDRVIMCDSIKESAFDEKGNEFLNTRWCCDSTSIYYSINRILFYESMFYNKSNNMIERDVLGYSLQRYIEDRNTYKTVFIVFKDEKAVEKVKKNYTN